jgi:hypothetical protein
MDMGAIFRLIAEAEAAGYTGREIDTLRRLAKSATHQPAQWNNDRFHTALVVNHRLAHQHLMRHLELAGGAL